MSQLIDIAIGIVDCTAVIAIWHSGGHAETAPAARACRRVVGCYAPAAFMAIAGTERRKVLACVRRRSCACGCSPPLRCSGTCTLRSPLRTQRTQRASSGHPRCALAGGATGACATNPPSPDPVCAAAPNGRPPLPPELSQPSCRGRPVAALQAPLAAGRELLAAPSPLPPPAGVRPPRLPFLLSLMLRIVPACHAALPRLPHGIGAVAPATAPLSTASGARRPPTPYSHPVSFPSPPSQPWA